MSQLDNKQKLAKQEKIIFKILWIPIVILLSIVPLIVRLTGVSVSGDVENLIQTPLYGDFFSQFKSVGIILLCVAMLILLFLLYQKGTMKKDKQLILYTSAVGVFLLLSFISAICSSYKDVAFWGLPDRAEGFVILACYIIMFLYTIYIFRNTKDYKYIIVSTSVLIIILTILGVFQYFGHDLLMQKGIINRLVMPEKYADLAENVQAQYESGKIYGTLFHYNYMGSFGAIMVPLFMTLTLFVRGYKRKIALGVIAICSLFLLLGSTSRAGLVGVAISVLVAIIVFAKVIIRKWKLTVPVVVGLGVVLIGFNILTNGTMFQRIPTLVQDAFGIFMPADKSFNYKEHIPVKSITSQDGKTIIEMQKGTLLLAYVEDRLFIVDDQGDPVKFDIQDNIGSTTDSRFSELQFQLISLQEESQVADGAILMFNGKECFVVRINEEQGVYLADNYTNEPLVLEEAPYWGFEGKEKLGSARGYIWSRSLPMLKDTVLIGNGPDTFALEFPQNDRLAKWWAYDTPNMLVDKPHNLYLQIALNEGILALLAFLVLVGAYIIDSFRLYALKSYYEGNQIVGMATSLGIIGYLGAGVFNDSIVSVAPIFWILLGTGVAINYINNKEQVEVKKRVAHATVDIKTREHI